MCISFFVFFCLPADSTHGQDETGDDLELSKYTNELMALVAQEGGVNLYRGSFEDEFGEIHDWQSDLVTHHYLCRQLYLHYNQQVFGHGYGKSLRGGSGQRKYS